MLAMTIFLDSLQMLIKNCSGDCDPNPTLTYALLAPEKHTLFILTIKLKQNFAV